MLLTLALVGGECSASRTGHFTPQWKSPRYTLYRILCGPRAGLDVVAKRKNPFISPTGNQTPVIPSVAWSLYWRSCYLYPVH